MIIDIEEVLIQRIRQHGTRDYPNECCGALVGETGCEGEKRHALDILPLDNRRAGDPARRRYLITAADHFRIEKEARDRGQEILGFYHSHPDHPAEPSPFDLEHALPWYVYLILPVEDGVPGELTGWLLADDRSGFEPVSIHPAREKEQIKQATR